MKHPCLPSTMTPENLASWIKDNADEVIDHIEKTPLEEEQTHELQSQSSLASRAMDRLEAIKKEFNDVIKEGTPDIEMPYDITIPPTKGMKILKANRAFADRQLENGMKETPVQLYKIPYPEESLMVAVDIEGNEWPDFTKEMTNAEVNKHKPMLKRDKKPKKSQSSFIDEDEDDSATPVLNLDL